MPKKQKTTHRNIFIASGLALVLFFSLGSAAQAQFGIPQPVISTEVVSVPTTQQTIWQRITKTLENVWKKNGSRAYQQAIRSVTYKLAQDTATFVASGGKGQKPLLFSDPGRFLRDSGDQVAGDFLVKLADGFPIDLCSADSIKSKLAFNIGANKSLLDRKYAEYDLGKPGCKLSAIKNNFAAAAKAENFLINVATTFEPGKNDISTGLALFADAKKAEEHFVAAEMARRGQNGDFQGLTDLLTKYPNTPKDQVQAAILQAQEQALKVEQPRTEDIFIDTFAVFTNTLTKTYLNKLSGGYYPFRKTAGGPDSQLATGSNSVQALLASFAVFSPQRAPAISATGEIDLFSDMISCPQSQYQTPYNCLLNDELKNAIQNGLTVGQAVNSSNLDLGNLQFPQSHDSQSPNLSLENLRKLRFLRVLPIGWEIAAERLKKQEKTMTLRAVVNCGKDVNDGCGERGNSVVGLIDPDWVLALPPQYCRAEGIGPVPEGEKSAARRSWCVDLQSCIKEDGAGNCQAFGYCTQERAVWKLAGQSCEKQYATCQVLHRADGTTVGMGKTTGILGSDVNKNGCTQANAGCAWFSTTRSGSGWDSSKRIYLTNLAPSCQPEDAGSREIIPLEPGTNLISNLVAGEAQSVFVKPYTYYTLSFLANNDEALLGAYVTGPVRNVSFPAADNDSVGLTVPAGESGRRAAMFFSQTAEGLGIIFTNDNFRNAQLEEIGLADGQRAQAAMAAVGADLAVAAPSTDYKDYQDNRKLVFAGAAECSPEEAAARNYTPLNGGESKVARLAAGDLCPAACVGLEEYLAMPTTLETISRTVGDYPKRQSFIAAYAQSCSAAEVGCEQFTNLTVAAGAENREYYSQVRSCVLDTNPAAATFYTWEGTDTAGFQLKAWQLLKENGTGAPCNDFSQSSTVNPADAVCAAGAVADCALNEGNPDCRVFLDENGREFKRDATKVVSAAAQCSPYRRSRDGVIWYFLAKESKQCSSAAVACREYKGGRANVTTRLLNSNFENINPHGWSQASGAGATVSPESVIAGKYSLRLSGRDTKIIAGNANLAAGSAFLIDFLAKNGAAGALTKISLSAGADTADFDLSGLALSAEWQEFRFGPLLLAGAATARDYTLTIESAGAVFMDNIELLASSAQFYITDSWQGKQPAACSAYQQCEAYKDDSSNTFYTARFAKLFGADSVYCRAVIDTQNSDSPAAESFNQNNATPLDDYPVAADKLEYRIIKPANLRPALAAGCTALGVPDDAANPAAWPAVTYRLLDPDAFKQGSLCQAEGLGCQNFQNEQGESFSFRDPGKKLCAWDANKNTFVKIDLATNKQTDIPCEEGRVADVPGTWYVAQCPTEQSSCTAYAPTAANLTEGPSSALFMRKDTVEIGSCQAGDGISAGCVKFTEGYSAAGDIPEDKLFKAQESLLSVKATRQCAEWLSPTTSSTVNDPKTRSTRTVVYDLGRCQKLGANGLCLAWTNQTQATYPRAYFNPAGGLDKFQADQYAKRFAGGKSLFNGAWDYSGYSIPNQYPVELLKESAANLSCRSFPEEDAPFDSDRLSQNRNNADGLNKCEPGETCQCNYKKVTTTDGTVKYYNTNTVQAFPNEIKSIVDLAGWQGYCAEWDQDTKDPSGAPVCLAWWPVDVIQNSSNIFDNHPEAGFTTGGPQYYCLQAKGNKLADTGVDIGLEAVSVAAGAGVKNNNYLIRVANYDTFFEKSSGEKINGSDWVPFSSLAAKKPLDFNESGHLKFPVKPGPLKNLREYDIEAIIFKTKDIQHDDWPAVGEEVILQREGFAKSPFASPETNERWSAFWCGGSADARCEFSGKYSWDLFYPFFATNHCASTEKGAVSTKASTNLFALRAVFADAKGQGRSGFGDGEAYQFLGFEGGLCDNTQENGWVDFDIIFQLREWCTTVARVTDTATGENKAWTARLNQKSITSDLVGGLYNADISPEQLNLKGGAGLDYKYNQDKSPFGAMTPPAATIYLPTDWDARKDEAAPDEFSGEKDVKILEPGRQPLYVETDRGQVRAGSPYSCPESDKCVIPPADNGFVLKQAVGDNPDSSLRRAVSYLQQIFAKIYGVWQWDEKMAGYREESDLLAADRDLTTKANGWPGQCPVITPDASSDFTNEIGAGDCRLPAQWGYYAIKNQPPIITARDHVLGLGDWVTQLIAIGDEVTLQFYAYNANGEQLPLRKIAIDWNDGVKTVVAGSFKNHQPDCNNASPNYGQTDQACDSNKFEFKHVYTASGSFIPAVTVWDNWGRFTVASYQSPGSNVGVITVKELKAVSPFTAPSGREFVTIPALTPNFGWEAQWRNTTNANNTRLKTMAEIEPFPVARTLAADEREINYPPRAGRTGLPDDVGDREGEWFAVAWTGVLKVDVAGNYKFKLTSNDGSDLYLDDLNANRVIDNTGDHNYRAVESSVVNLYQGNHAIRVRFYNNTSDWGIKLEWQKPGGAGYEIIPLANMLSLGTALSRVDQPAPAALPGTTGAVCPPEAGPGWCVRFNQHTDNLLRPALVDNYPYLTYKISQSAINYQNNDLAGLLPAGWVKDHYGLSWEGKIDVPESGNYIFNLGVDDGADLTIDGQIIINNDGDHGLIHMPSQPVNLSRGKHAIRLRMYNNGGPGDLTLFWKKPTDNGLTLLPATVIYLPATP